MKRFSARTIFALALLTAVFAFTLPLGAMAKAAENNTNTTDFTLDNGLKVILVENHRAPVASMLVWVKVGSASERSHEYGMAHVFEHMLFKGTKNRGPGEIAREIEASGGNINAYTSYDETVYYINIASRFTDRGLDVLADMVFNPTFDPVEFEREKEVVLEELRRGEDNPNRQLSEKVFSTAFKVHPYGRPIIGYLDTVKSFHSKNAVDFHKRWYKPGNMLLVVAGDFDANQVRSFIQKTFGTYPSGTVPEDKRPVEPPQKDLRTAILRLKVETASLRMAYHIPESSSDDIVALDLLGMVLGDGRTSRLYREIKRNKELAHSVGSGTYTPKDPGLFVIHSMLDPDKALPVLEASLHEIEKLKAQGVSNEELARNKLLMRSYFVHSRATMSGEARVAANFEIFDGDYRAKEEYLAKIDRLTSEDLVRVAKKYLKPDNLTVGLMLPEKAEPDLTEKSIAAAVEKGSAPVNAAAKESVKKEGFKKFTLENGAKLLVKEDHSLPLASFRVAFLGGLRYETPDKLGLNNMLAEVWDRGTTRLSPPELARETENMAAVIASFSGRNSFGLEAEFLSDYIDKGMDLLVEVLTKPALDQAEVERAKPAILAALRKRNEQSASQAFRMYAETMYKGHPYARDTLGTPETVAGLTADDLRGFYEKYAKPGNAVITVVGDVDAGHIKDRFEKLFKDWTGKAAAPPQIGSPEKWEGLRTESLKEDRQQAHLILGFPAPGMKSPDRYPLEVLNSILSGQGGRMFIQLRDKQSLAYSLSSFYSAGLGPGSFGLYIAFDPSKQAEVDKGLEKLIRDIVDNPPTDEEVRGAKEYILGAYDIGMQKTSAQAAEATFNVLYDMGLDYPEKIRGRNQRRHQG